MKEAFNVRLEELHVIDLALLHGCAQPTLLVLYMDKNECHIKTYTVSLLEKDLRDGPWKFDNVCCNLLPLYCSIASSCCATRAKVLRSIRGSTGRAGVSMPRPC